MRPRHERFGLVLGAIGVGVASVVAGSTGAAIAVAAVAGWGWWQAQRRCHEVETALARAEAEQAASQRDRAQQANDLSQLLALLSDVPVAIVWVRAGMVQWANQTACTWLALRPARHLGQPVVWFLPDTTCWSEAVRAGANGVTKTVQIGQRTFEWRLYWFAHTDTPESGLLWIEDATERQRVAAMRRDFVANVSHELRTPLTVLIGGLETLAERDFPLEPAQRSELIAQCEREAKRMLRLVRDLLQLAELESGAPPAFEWISVAALIDEAAELAWTLAPEGLTVTVALPEPLATAQLHGDEAELATALRNLVSNAVRYTPAPGRVTIGATAQGDALVLWVEDTGIGIPEEHLPRLTERFYRVDRARSRASGGTGLGLAIVQHVAERHGARLAITSEVGKGSCFRLDFPRPRWRVTTVAHNERNENQQ
ncbi:ATP-binding protein [Hydrogenophilus thermoluteolus]|uniref:histidine kinase n=1 Tax=Hydrogenophilus thermoluteolus TaxID=297 RepID=A0A2Z6DVA1_HYDTE|nr:ATP-binding protein [Hydrogenophilus thermoluteolus]BBD76366.1 signal transduction histidine kinase [Hydrogenophilus thermoluteolus]